MKTLSKLNEDLYTMILWRTDDDCDVKCKITK